MRPQPGFEPSVTTLGSGARRVLALHCTMAHGGAWSGLAKHIGEAVTLVAPDMPSHGTSADWDEVSDFSDTVYQASLGVMDAGPMDVIGHSFGAATALRIAAFNPERVRSLTVFEPVFFAAALRRDPASLAAHAEDAKPYVAAITARDYPLAARLFNRMWSAGGPKWDDLPTRTRAAMARAIHVVPDTERFLFEDAAGLLAPGALDALEVPTLVMRGEMAHPAIVATNDGLADLIPGAEQSVIAGAGHMAPISHPAEVAAALQGLLGRS